MVKPAIGLILLTFVATHACELKSRNANHTVNYDLAKDGGSKRHPDDLIDPEGTTIFTRIKPPDGSVRVDVSQGTFAHYLRTLPLKPHDSKVMYFDGSTKPNYDVYVAVVDFEIGTRDLHQCADAVMRLRAEYLWGTHQYEQIHFNFTNGFRANYSRWMNGERIRVKGNDVSWFETNKVSNSYRDFWKYLEMVFSYAGTASLTKELVSVEIQDMKIGDVFIQGGFPGHAVIVVDMAIEPASNKKFFMLAQSYMPAQETQILMNPSHANSPWYSTDITEKLITPEWTFDKKDLKRFAE